MKYFLTILLSTSYIIRVSAQADNKFIIDQLFISVNRTMEKGYDTENRVGYGLGIYHTFLPARRFSFNTGIEFNRTRQFEQTVVIGHFGSYNDLAFSKNCISLPFNTRITFGQKVKYFLEVGGFWDWVISSKQKGILHTYLPDGNWVPQHKFIDINENANLANSFGFSFGPGILIPSRYFDIIIKPDYKHKYNTDFYGKDNAMGKYIRLNMGISLN